MTGGGGADNTVADGAKADGAKADGATAADATADGATVDGVDAERIMQALNHGMHTLTAETASNMANALTMSRDIVTELERVHKRAKTSGAGTHLPTLCFVMVASAQVS